MIFDETKRALGNFVGSNRSALFSVSSRSLSPVSSEAMSMLTSILLAARLSATKVTSAVYLPKRPVLLAPACSNVKRSRLLARVERVFHRRGACGERGTGDEQCRKQGNESAGHRWISPDW